MAIVGAVAIIIMMVFLVMAGIAKLRKNGSPKRYLLLALSSFGVMVIAMIIDISNDGNVPSSTEVSTEKVEKEKPKEKEITLTIDEKPERVLLKTEAATIHGTTKNADTLKINNKDVALSEDGTFEHEIKLVEGDNNITLIASNSDKDLTEKVESILIVRQNPPSVLNVGDATSKSNKFRIEGSTEFEANVTVFKGDKEVANVKSNSDGDFGAEVDTVEEGKHEFTVKVSKEDYQDSEENVTITRELSEKEKAAAKRASAQTIPFSKLEKNPDRLAGEYVKYQGQIVQILEEGESTTIRMSVTQESYGWSVKDIIMVQYYGLTDFVEEDVVTVYGEIFGSHTYQSTAGWDISIPLIMADSVE